MGIFAVLADDAASGFVLEELHLNLWCLPSFMAHHLICDVGLKMRGAVPKELELWLPFEPDTEIVDLHNTLVVPDHAQLIFNEPVEVENNKLQFPSGQTFALARAEAQPPELKSNIWSVKV